MKTGLSFDRKYRPKTFNEVLDQEDTVKVLKNIIINKKYASPLMFTGIFGGGKTTLARITARAILCENITDEGEPCNICPSCVSFNNESNLAYVEIDAASNSGVESIRRLREEANLKVLGNSDRKVVVIDECHSITKQGNEALLKQLEDNNTNQVYILCTTNPQAMLETVRSRCLEFPIQRNTKESITKRLEYVCKQEGLTYTKEALDIIASETSPHVRNALKSLDLLSNYGSITTEIVSKHFNLSLNTDILHLIIMLKEDLREALILSNKLSNLHDPSMIYEYLIKNILNTCKLQYGVNEFKNNSNTELANKILETLGKDQLIKLLDMVLKKKNNIDNITLESDIILLNRILSCTDTNNEIQFAPTIPHTTPPTSSIRGSSQLKDPHPQKNNSSNEEKVIETNQKLEESASTPMEDDAFDNNEDINLDENTITLENSELDETQKVTARYKAYPPQLAMLFEKSKKQSSMNSNKSVELNQGVRDFKHNLPYTDIRNYIKLKRT